MAALRVGIAGLGFIGKVHVNAARRTGGFVAGVAGGNPEKTARIAGELGIEVVHQSSESLATSPDIDVLHICTPNHLHADLARLALDAGKHVVCEKPLATTLADAESLTSMATSTGLIAAVPFVYRFHPMVREARARVASGEAGELRLIHGSYQQDWLASPDDYNWRVDPKLGGQSRAFADIGSHWCDLIEFVTGHRIMRLSARLITAIHERTVSDAVAFSKTDLDGEVREVGGDDAVTVMFETDRGAAGSLLVSQVSIGRKNRLWFEVDGAKETLVFDQENAEQLWIGKRDHNEISVRDPGALSMAAARYVTLPAGHAQGYGDAFDGFVKDVYAAIAGDVPDGLPTFDDGLRAARLTDAVMQSGATGAWKEIQQ